MTPSAPTSNKRKPPTFRHLPQERAKKLKEAWVAKQKIKSKWKAQKRKEGIVTQRDPQPDVAENDDEGTDAAEESPEEEPKPAAPPRREQPQDEQAAPTTSDKPSLRELQRQAYSRASLHHFKAQPLRHSKKHGADRGAEAVGQAQRGAGRGAACGRGRGGGQPNMSLRMSAMLEKIKRDYS
ncbi:hypothetical protein BC834DRAFT_966060 [Gloeopeniophorella convolvens]|nr:hypothetical protein BC834DRAFT_966060 [Gloeopeniophorella convolvens]